MFALPFFRRDAPALKGERITLRMPVSSDYREWAKLRGESRTFLEDGDTVILRARCDRAGCAPIGFGECAGTVNSAV